ncbi:MCE family protein [Nocardioides marmorisolisilvae]|uniref:MCE family protein n=1 Tax=Nocardioides marmorisolisilvae TaxID=1542737 RepID=A0A3N0DX35_9ACTN|nr:MlaD family protein [Nocardioides marmorisolisilvae]RNL80169.1 MCE family protein [Nocardioides marmorisolisilvae]
MISRRIRIQLVAFVLLAVIGIVYAGAKYAGMASLVQQTTYTVHLDLADTGGIFTNAEVTYRGVGIGRVGKLKPTEQGADVELVIRKSAPHIPSDGLKAEVKNLSVIGELYVDLTPTASGSPYLRNGSVIPASATRTPIAPARLLAGLNNLLQSVPPEQTTTVLDELSAAFANGGGDLGRLLDSSSELLTSARASLEQTQALIDASEVVLRTQNASADNVLAFSTSLKLLSQRLKAADPSLNRLIGNAPLLTTEVSDLLRESGTGFSHLIADLLTTSRLVDPRGDGLRELLVTYPVLSRAAYSAVPGDGTAHFGLVLNAFDPQPCTRGYQTTAHRAGSSTAGGPVNKEATCAEPQGSPIDVRGTQNVPREPIPDAVPYPSSSSEGTTEVPGWGWQPRWVTGPDQILSGH